MTIIRNERDKRLRLAPNRVINPASAKILLIASPNAFNVDSEGNNTPDFIDFILLRFGLPGGVLEFTASGGTVTSVDDVATLQYDDMTADTAEVTATLTVNGDVFIASQIVTKIIGEPPPERGPVTVQFSGHSSWSDLAAEAELAAAGFGEPVNRDAVTLFDATHSTAKFYDSSTSSWLALTAHINGNLLVDGTISCAALVADTMTGQTYRTSAGYPRIQISGTTHKLEFHDSSGTLEVQIGGTSASVFAQRPGGTSPNFYASNTGGFSTIPAIAGHGSGWVGVSGLSTLNYGGDFYSTTSSALCARGGSSGANPSCELDGSIMMVARGSGVALSFMNGLVPATDDYYPLGSSSLVWSECRATNFYGVYNTPSDARLKTDIKTIGPALALILALRPVSYKVIEAGKTVVFPPQQAQPDTKDKEGWDKHAPPPMDAPQPIVKPRAGVRNHFGLIAQEVRTALVDAGLSDAGVWGLTDSNDPNSLQHLNYVELIAPLIGAVQELTARVIKLEKK